MLTLRRSIRLMDQLPLPNGDRLLVHLDVEARLPALIRAQNDLILAARNWAGTPGDRPGGEAGASGRGCDSGAAGNEGALRMADHPGNSEGCDGPDCGRRAADGMSHFRRNACLGDPNGFHGRGPGGPEGSDAATERGTFAPTEGKRASNPLPRRCDGRKAVGASGADTSDPFFEAYRALLQIVLGQDGLKRALAAYDGDLPALCVQLDGWIGARLTRRIRAASARAVRRRKSEARRMLRRAR